MSIETKPVKSRKVRERGSTLVEFSLTLLPLLGFLMLTIDMAWAIFAWASIHEGVREGVRLAITMQSDANIINRVQQYSFGFVTNPSNVQIYYFSPTNSSTPLTGPNSNSPGNVVQIVVSGVSVTPMAPIWRSSSPLTLTTSSADIVEPNPNPLSSPRY